MHFVTADGASYTIIKNSIFHLQFDLRIVIGGRGVVGFLMRVDEVHALSRIDQADKLFAVCFLPMGLIRAGHGGAERCWLGNRVGIERERRTVVDALVSENGRWNVVMMT